jgi:hypothetical protein
MVKTWRVSRPVRAVCMAITVVITALAPARSAEEAAICVTAKVRWRRLVLPVIHAVEAAGDHGCRQVVRAADNVGDDFGIFGIRDTGFEDAEANRQIINHLVCDALVGDVRF